MSSQSLHISDGSGRIVWPSGGLQILAAAVVEFTAGPHCVFVRNRVMLWPSHFMRPVALTASEEINDETSLLQ
jgi:hypothetical protein